MLPTQYLFALIQAFGVPTLRKVREGWATHCVAGAGEINNPASFAKLREKGGAPGGTLTSCDPGGFCRLCFLALAVMTVWYIPYCHDVMFPQEHIAGGGVASHTYREVLPCKSWRAPLGTSEQPGGPVATSVVSASVALLRIRRTAPPFAVFERWASVMDALRGFGIEARNHESAARSNRYCRLHRPPPFENREGWATLVRTGNWLPIHRTWVVLMPLGVGRVGSGIAESARPVRG